MTDDARINDSRSDTGSARLSRRSALLASAASLAVVAGRSVPAAAQDEPAPRPPRVPREEAAVSLYVVSLADDRRGPLIRPYRGVVTVDPAERRVAAAALALLLAGPGDDVLDAGSVSAIPAGISVVSADLGDGGTVRVALAGDLLGAGVDGELADRLATPAAGQDGSADDRARRLRLAQIVFTLTQFETITAVDLIVDGEPVAMTDVLGNPIDGPVGRQAFEDVSPLILIERPLPGETIGAECRVSGTANTFEASLSLRLTTGDGDVLLDVPVQATSGNGTRGTFEASLTVPDGTAAGPLTLLGYEASARDGSEVNRFEVPLRFDD